MMWKLSFVLFVYSTLSPYCFSTYVSPDKYNFCVNNCTITNVFYGRNPDRICYLNEYEVHSHSQSRSRNLNVKRFTCDIWPFPNSYSLINELVLDPERVNSVRTVNEAIFSYVKPQPMKNPQLIALSNNVMNEILNVDVRETEDIELFTKFASGNYVHLGSKPISHRYGGHQFGVWAGQLGDGRAHILGEYVNAAGEHWELQLKGSGKTPYSRDGDGRAVLRSSIREYLASEAMFALGIPTTRAASLVVSEDTVIRDKLYNGNPRPEKTAVVLRLSPSWFRFGSLEILNKNNETKLLRKLVDYIIDHHFPTISLFHVDHVLQMYTHIVDSTAELIAKWQSVGFVHGVGNTDNFSILSLTLDYGPFAFMDDYNPEMVPNISDDEGRYSYKNQRAVAAFNLNKLRLALDPLLDQFQRKDMETVLMGYIDLYHEYLNEFFRHKFGFVGYDSKYADIIQIFLEMLEDEKSDFTMTFRQLGDWKISDIKTGTVPSELWALHKLSSHNQFQEWSELYFFAIEQSKMNDSVRTGYIHSHNPIYVLRNWMAEEAIQRAENNDFSLVHRLQSVLKNPFTPSKSGEKMKYSSPVPNWAKDIKISCSS